MANALRSVAWVLCGALPEEEVRSARGSYSATCMMTHCVVSSFQFQCFKSSARGINTESHCRDVPHCLSLVLMCRARSYDGPDTDTRTRRFAKKAESPIRSNQIRKKVRRGIETSINVGLVE